MILGVGIDLCQIERIARAIEKPRFFERVFTERERERLLAAPQPRRAEIAAGLFAAKEAVSKALGTGFDGFFTDAIEILPDPAGRPLCTLHGGAAARAEDLSKGAYALFLSITHEAGMAAAVAILEGEQGTGNRQRATGNRQQVNSG